MFASLPRQKFRKYFQPSRIVIAVLPDTTEHSVNLITVCFDMYCSYKPPMMAFAVWNGSHTFSLLENASECVLGIPGEKMAETAMFCGVKSGKDVDKISACRLTLLNSKFVTVPSISECIANIELKITQKVSTGDHMTVFGEVLNFGVNIENEERCLLSVGAKHDGYEVLAKHGIHRIGVASSVII